MNKKQWLKNEQGLTLVEVMAAVLILALVTISLYGVYDYSMKSFKWGGDYADSQEEGRFIMQKITNLVKNGFDIHTSQAENGLHLDVLSDRIAMNLLDIAQAKQETSDVAGTVYSYLRSEGAFALKKPSVGGHLQVEGTINPSGIQPGQAAALYLIAPRTDGLADPDFESYVGIKVDNTGNLIFVERVNGEEPKVYPMVSITAGQEIRIRLSLNPSDYNSPSHQVAVYANSSLAYGDENGDNIIDERPKASTWVGQYNLAYVRFGIEGGTEEVDTVWQDMQIFYNSNKCYTSNNQLYYQKNEEPAMLVSESVYSFKVAKPKSGLVNIEMAFKNGTQQGSSATYTLNSSVKYQGR